MRFFGRDDDHAALQPLRQIKLFSSLTARELKVVYGLRHERHYLAGEIVFDQGDEGQAIYAIVEGEVEILRAEGGSPHRLALLAPGEVFGELALLDQAPRAAQARALSDCRLVVFFRADFMSLLETHPKIASKIALALARHLGGRLRQANAGARQEGHL
ncbi:MAG: cyclic nucleotide-binding domain-containing protein [Methyloversatilis sp.]|uniref:cAMP-binding protein n=1 Tax=Methyloversatilis universalis (strain ATCC BAA-1314 / DSM 25237 / JCM 13912 / CCUG 52030 / FAM5) TaxID=1000565 RepID=F5RA90_METUF|nr:cyclic nucleotide-binding domain-containing protein [Methyloversatilis universalis]EGK72406.1 cAMP-binding protein [Methyloversatilis universalis FAM5]MCP4635603.1 cyclic nucleotide-binding domain-containing protein [Methyloversatilis sp.]